jgi:energy-coupling factor transport system permease protein
MLITTCLFLSYIGGVSRSVAGLLRFFIAFALVVFVVNLVANQHGEHPLLSSTFRFYFWRITFRITLESISAATRMVLRLLALILSFLLFTLTTKPEKLMARFSTIRGMEGFGLLLGLAYKFMPVIVADGIEVRDSLRTRGVRFDEGSRIERARSYASLGVPLLINSLDRSLQLSEALEARGYGSGRRWSVPPLTGNRFDAVASVYGLILGGILLFIWISHGIGSADLFFLTGNFVYLPIIFVALVLPITWRWIRDRD